MATMLEIQGFSVSELSSFIALKLEGKVDSAESLVAVLNDNKITGKMFLNLRPDELREMIPVIGERKIVKEIIDSFSSTVTSRYGTFKVPGSNGSANQMKGERNSQWLSAFQLPKFSTRTMQSLEAKQISKGMRIEIVAALAFEIWNHTQYPSGDEYNAVCTMLVNKYTFLKDTIGNGYGSWKLQLRQKLKNMRRPSEKGCQKDEEQGGNKELPDDDEDESNNDEISDEVAVDEVVDVDEHLEGTSLSQKSKPKKPIVPHKKIKLSVDRQEEMKQLEAELQKKKPDSKFVKKAMDATFLERRMWIQEECPSVKEILLKYPVFKKSKYVRRELFNILEYNNYSNGVHKAREELNQLSFQVKAQAQLERATAVKQTLSNLPNDADNFCVQDMNTIKLLAQLLVPRTKAKVFHELSALEDIKSNIMQIKQNEPYVVVAELEATKRQFFVVVERSITIESDTFQDALTDMIGLYFIMDITYPSSLNPVLLSIQRFVLGINDKQIIPPVVTRLLSSLDQHQLTDLAE